MLLLGWRPALLAGWAITLAVMLGLYRRAPPVRGDPRRLQLLRKGFHVVAFVLFVPVRSGRCVDGCEGSC